MMTGEMIALGSLLLGLAVALARVWIALNRKIDDMDKRIGRHQVAVIREFASIGHFEKLEGKLDRLIEKIEHLGLQLASQSRASTRSHTRAADAQ